MCHRYHALFQATSEIMDSSVTEIISITIVFMKVGLKNIKQISHALFQATSEIMDSSAIEIAPRSKISTRASQCMYICLLFVGKRGR